MRRLLRELSTHLRRQDRQLGFLSEDLASRYEEIDLLYTITEMLTRTGRFEEAAASMLATVADAVGAARVSLALLDESGESLRIVASRGLPLEGNARVIPLDDATSIAARVAREGQPLTGTADGSGSRSHAGESYLCLPVSSSAGTGGTRCLGVLSLANRREGGRFSAAEQKIVAAAANQIGVAITLSRMLEQEREQQRLRGELELSRELQRLLLPSPAVLRDDAEVAARCVPTEAVGGDFYTFNRLGLGVVAVMLGDVASHGFPAALVMAAVMATAGIQAGSGASPDVTLKSLHENLGERLSFVETYLTVFYGILDPGRGLLTWASAGHPYAFRVPRAGPAERLETTAPPLGLGNAEDISARSVSWDREGDLLCLWTDGLVDAESGSGERFGEPRLVKLLEESRGDSAEAIVSRVMTAVDAFAEIPRDDRTLLVLRL